MEMEYKETECKQGLSQEQKMIREFFKEFLSWNTESIGNWLGAGVAEFFFLLSIGIIPFQEMLEEIIGPVECSSDVLFVLIFAVLGWLPAFYYIGPYIAFKEERKDCSITAKLKYLPVDLKEIQKMRVIYVMKFIGKQFLAAFCLQMLAAWFICHEITWMNVVYVICAALLWPAVLVVPVAIWGRKNR